MRLTAVLAIACLFTLAFAGCSGKDKDDGDGTSTTTSSSRSTSSTSTSSSATATTTSSSSTSTTSSPSNRAPTGSISVFVNGSAASFNLTGSDPDGDTIAWDLDFGDGNATNGTVLPQLVNHTYAPGNGTGNATVGNVTAVFTITDGKSPVSYNATISLGSGAKDGLTIAGETTGVDPTADGIPTLGGCLLAEDGVGGSAHTLEALIDGWAWTLADDSYSVWFYGPGEPVGPVAPPASLGGGSVSGTVPAGATSLAICTGDSANAEGGTFLFVATEP